MAPVATPVAWALWWDCDAPPGVRKSSPFSILYETNGMGFWKPQLCSGRTLEYESSGRGFESYASHFHSHRSLN